MDTGMVVDYLISTPNQSDYLVPQSTSDIKTLYIGTPLSPPPPTVPE